MNFFKVFFFFLVIYSLSSCTSKSKEATLDSTAGNIDSLSVSEIEEQAIASLSVIIPLIPEAEFPLSYTETDNDFEAYTEESKVVYKSCNALRNILPDSVLCDGNVYFVKKGSFSDLTIIDFVTTWMNAKGPCTYHHLVTVNNKGEVIDIYPEWAAMYAMAVENPNGGTSAGIAFRYGTIETSPMIRITSYPEEGESKMIEVSPDGHFVEPGQFFPDGDGDLRGDTTGGN